MQVKSWIPLVQSIAARCVHIKRVFKMQFRLHAFALAQAVPQSMGGTLKRNIFTVKILK